MVFCFGLGGAEPCWECTGSLHIYVFLRVNKITLQTTSLKIKNTEISNWLNITRSSAGISTATDSVWSLLFQFCWKRIMLLNSSIATSCCYNRGPSTFPLRPSLPACTVHSHFKPISPRQVPATGKALTWVAASSTLLISVRWLPAEAASWAGCCTSTKPSPSRQQEAWAFPSIIIKAAVKWPEAIRKLKPQARCTRAHLIRAALCLMCGEVLALRGWPAAEKQL